MSEKYVTRYGNTIFYEIDKASIYLRAKGSQIFDSFNFGITVDQYCVLDAVYHNEDICQRDIAKLILKDRSNTGRILNILEEKGLIERRVETKENRLVKKVYITKLGEEKVSHVFPIIRECYLAAISDITEEEMSTLKKILNKLSDNLSKSTTMQI